MGAHAIAGLPRWTQDHATLDVVAVFAGLLKLRLVHTDNGTVSEILDRVDVLDRFGISASLDRAADTIGAFAST
jgi:hypothetical protein